MKTKCCCCNIEFNIPDDAGINLIKLESCLSCRKKAKEIILNNLDMLIKAQAVLLFGTVKDMYKTIGIIK